MMRFDGTAALVTGAASGIGEGIARQLHAEGGRVFLVDRDEPRLAETLDDLGPGATGIAADALAEGTMKSAITQAYTDLGHIDILVNNVAYLDSFGSVTDTTLELWRTALEGTVTSAFLASSQVLPDMVARKAGCIINVASVLGIVGKVDMSGYMAAKAALIHLTRSIAIDYGQFNVRCNAVCPAAIDTENNRRFTAEEQSMSETTSATVLGRLGEVHEVASAVAFLASAEASYITGAVLCVDGGWTLR